MLDLKIQSGPFEPNFESLSKFECPAWFPDAKFGIWAHWGAQSVPMYGDWYARNIYYEGSEQYLYHLRHYGHPSQFGYKDIVKLWKAEKFDPEALMDLYVNAGAKFFVTQAMHHDNFFNYASGIHRWNSVDMGPHKDIVGMWKETAKKRGLPFGITEHMSTTFPWYRLTKGADKEGPYAGVPYDGNDHAYEDLYLPNHEHYDPEKGLWDIFPLYTSNQWWQKRWFECIKEVIDLYEPDLLYTDGTIPFGESMYEAGLHIIAHLYNSNAAKNNGVNKAIYTQKEKRQPVSSVGVLTIERCQAPDIVPKPWSSETCVGDWFYNVRTTYKKTGHVIEILVDVVSKNGNLVLNIPQKPDGTLDEECTYILKELAKWNNVCSEGIYGTRPYRISGEGPSTVALEQFKEKAAEWTSSDFRFTRKGNTLYAFQMRWPKNNRAVITSLATTEKVKAVRLLGAGNVEFEQSFGALTVNLPDYKPTQYINCLAIELE